MWRKPPRLAESRFFGTQAREAAFAPHHGADPSVGDKSVSAMSSAAGAFQIIAQGVSPGKANWAVSATPQPTEIRGRASNARPRISVGLMNSLS